MRKRVNKKGLLDPELDVGVWTGFMGKLTHWGRDKISANFLTTTYMHFLELKYMVPAKRQDSNWTNDG